MPYAEIITGVCTIIVAAMYILSERRSGLNEISSHKETIKQIKGFDGLALTFDQQIRISEGAKKLFAETEVDRFVTLLAFNGKERSRWVTAFMPFLDGKWQIGNYFNYEIDEHYNKLLKTMRLGGDVCFTVADMPEDATIRRDVYEPEGVLCSKWGGLAEKELDNGVVQILFCSAASHKVSEFSQSDRAKIKSFMDMYGAIIREATQ